MGNGPKVKPHNDHSGYHGRPVMGPKSPRGPVDYHTPGAHGQGPRVKPHNDHSGEHGRPVPGALAQKPPETYEHARMPVKMLPGGAGKSRSTPMGKPPMPSSKAD